VGKGTQADLLAKRLGLRHVATGDLFRDHLKRETSLGRLAQGYMERGELVPDEVTIGMLRERIEQPDAAKGVLLDGFPRTQAQAEALAAMLAEMGESLLGVVSISAPTEVLLNRLVNRWTCSQCGAIYNLTSNQPHAAGACDRCGGKLVQRADDQPDVQRKRIEVYLQQTLPLIAYYRDRALLMQIDGEQSIDEVHHNIVDAIAELKNRHQAGPAERLTGAPGRS
jgi:adenylate kinase